jgi:hypothetical protein
VKATQECSVDGCDGPIRARGYCNTHYLRWRRTGSTDLPEITPAPIATCSVTGCGKIVRARGWCGLHYKRWQATGDPLKAKIIHGEDERRFWRQVDRSGGPVACWPWTGKQTFAGYGRFWADHKSIGATRWLMGHLRGKPLDRGEQACHHCDNPPCCNPAHLYVGDAVQNMRDRKVRGRARNPLAEAMAAKTHCGTCGAAYDEANTYIKPSGGRDCRACQRAWSAAYRARNPRRKAGKSSG